MDFSTETEETNEGTDQNKMPVKRVNLNQSQRNQLFMFLKIRTDPATCKLFRTATKEAADNFGIDVSTVRKFWE